MMKENGRAIKPENRYAPLRKNRRNGRRMGLPGICARVEEAVSTLETCPLLRVGFKSSSPRRYDRDYEWQKQVRSDRGRDIRGDCRGYHRDRETSLGQKAGQGKLPGPHELNANGGSFSDS